METAVAVMTHNPLVRFRLELVEQTVESITQAFPLAEKMLFDNGSQDGSHDELWAMVGNRRRWTLCTYVADDENYTPGRGRQEIMKTLGVLESDIIVFSDDDMCWRVGAEEMLESFWAEAPAELVVLCGFLEPNFHWSRPREVIRAGGVSALVRDSVPGAAWTFRRTDWITQLAPLVVSDFGYDHKACVKLKEIGKKVAAVDLATHEGWDVSTHGNRENRCAMPVDKKRWGLA